MAPKRPAKAGAKANVAKSGSKDSRWVQAQIASLKAQLEVAIKRGDTWLEVPHVRHQERLGEVLARLTEDPALLVPTELRDGVEFYVSQFADGAQIEQDAFYDDGEIYTDFLKVDVAEDTYVRSAETEEAQAAIELLARWEDLSMNGVSKAVRVTKEHQGSAGVQEAWLKRMSAVMREKGKEKGATVPPGLAPKGIVPLVAEAMGRFPQDSLLQLAGINTLHLAAAPDGAAGVVVEEGGAKLVVDAVRRHISDADVALCGGRMISFLAREFKKGSPEWASLCSAGAEKVLEDLIPCHQRDPRIDKVARQAIPFLRH